MILKYVLFFKGICLMQKKIICIVAFLVIATLMHCLPQKVEVNKASFHGVSFRLVRCNRQSEHTKYSTYHQQRTGNK